MKKFNKTYPIHLKKSKEHVEFRFRLKKYYFLGKKSFFKIFSIFFPKGGPFGVGIDDIYFLIFQNFQKKVLKMTSIEPKECWMKQSHEI